MNKEKLKMFEKINDIAIFVGKKLFARNGKNKHDDVNTNQTPKMSLCVSVNISYPPPFVYYTLKDKKCTQ
jgi:hypothetical protein